MIHSSVRRSIRLGAAVLVLFASAGGAIAQADSPPPAPPMFGPGIYPSSVVGFNQPNIAATCDGLSSPGDGWYFYLPSTPGWATISMCTSDGGSIGTFPPGQAVLQIWDAPAPPGIPVACSTGDPCCGGAPRVVFPVAVGQFFWVQIDYLGVGPAVGADTCTIAVIETALPPPPGFNDECVCAIPVFDGCNGIYNNTFATTSIPPAGCGPISDDMWFVYTYQSTVPFGGACTAFISTAQSSFDTVLSVWNNCPAFGGVEIACNNDSPKKSWPACWGTQQSYVEVPITTGQQIYIRVGGFGGATGSFQININTHYTYLIEETTPGFITTRHVNGCPFDLGLAVVHLEFSATPYYIGGECPHIGTGSFYGINASFAEVWNSLTFFFSAIPPFYASLNACGDASFGPFPWPGPLPFIDVVGFSVNSSFNICNVAPPIRYI